MLRQIKTQMCENIIVCSHQNIILCVVKHVMQSTTSVPARQLKIALVDLTCDAVVH